MQAKITQSIKPLADELLIGIFLAATGGFLDAYTYFFRGGVFANAQTGNMVLMAIYASKCDFNKAVYYLIPITAFFLGVLATEYLMRHGRLGGRWRQIVLALEIIILFCIGFLSQNVPNAYINVAVSFVCSLQVNAFKKISGLPYATTMCTGNLRSATEQLSLFIFEKNRQSGKNCIIYFVVIFFFCAGAVIGTVLTALASEKSVWLCCIMLMTVLFAIIKKR